MACNCNRPCGCHNSCFCKRASPHVEELCRESMRNCRSSCFRDTRPADCACNGEPVIILEPECPEYLNLERCCDPSGCCGLFPKCCRNPFWPSFAKPSWLCCRDLYRR